MIVLAQVASKDAAKCGMHCELRISVNELNCERIVQLWALSVLVFIDAYASCGFAASFS